MALGKSAFYVNDWNITINVEESSRNGDKMTSTQMALQIVDGIFSYGKSTILNKLNLNVMKGEIYALLGPSGCGKTTVLKCITKTLSLNSGEIRLFNNFNNRLKPRIPGPDVGYMPQELALFLDLTIEETLHLFAGINGVSQKVIGERINRLCQTFGITPLSRKIRDLSGGQKRRVSLIAILLHDPPLLILDEPTVGIDPVLRQTIWKYLMSMAKDQGKTVILTTHYIQEAKDATTVGLMRDGSLVAECSPTHLQQLFNETSLEVCFYRICEKSDYEVGGHNLFSRSNFNRNKQQNDFAVAKLNRYDCIDDWNLRIYGTSYFRLWPNNSSTRTVIALLKKNFKVLTRNIFLLLFQFILPAIIMVCFSSAIGTSLIDIPVAIVNEEDPPYYSALYLKYLNQNSVVQKHYLHMEDGVQSVKSGESNVVLYIDSEFSQCLHNRLILGVYSDNYTADCALLKMYMDNTNYISSLSLQMIFWKTFQNFVMDRLTLLEASPFVDSIPVSFEQPVYGSPEVTYNDYFTPNTLLYVLHYLPILLTAVRLVMERQNGAFERLRVCGVKTMDIILSQLLVNSVVILGQIVLVVIVQFVLFGSHCEGSLALVAVFLILEGYCGIVFGLFLSAICKDVNSVLLVGLSVSYPNLFVSGLIWPLEGMSWITGIICRCLPVTMSGEAVRAIMARGWGLERLTVWLGLLSIGSWTAIFLLGTILAIKRKL